MKILFLLGILILIGNTGCSPADKPEPKQKDKQREVEETARNILNNRVIMKEQGALTKEEAETAKNIITSPTSKNRRKRAIEKDAGGPPAPEGKDKKEAEAERHIDTK